MYERAPEDECPASDHGHYLHASLVRRVWWCQYCKQDIRPYGQEG